MQSSRIKTYSIQGNPIGNKGNPERNILENMNRATTHSRDRTPLDWVSKDKYGRKLSLLKGGDTMKKACILCKTSFKAIRKDQVSCLSCRKLYYKIKMKERHKKTYVKKGYSQEGKDNNNWKGGIGIYRDLIPLDYCNKCGSVENLLVHHINEDRYDNHLSNLECLCKKCHQIEHKCWEVLPKKEELSRLKCDQARNAKRDSKGKFKV